MSGIVSDDDAMELEDPSSIPTGETHVVCVERKIEISTRLEMSRTLIIVCG